MHTRVCMHAHVCVRVCECIGKQQREFCLVDTLLTMVYSTSMHMAQHEICPEITHSRNTLKISCTKTQRKCKMIQ